MSSASQEKITPVQVASTSHDDVVKGGNADGANESVKSCSGVDERWVMMKMDLWFIPWMAIVYLLSFFWRSNIGNGMNSLDSITPDVTFTKKQSDGALAMFYVVFIVWALPSVLIMEKLIKPKIWLSFNMVILGAAQIGMGWAKSYGSILAVRFFLAFGEACILPGLIIYLMHWYRRYETALRVSAIFGGGILIGSLAGILAFLLNLVLDKQKGYGGWRWILTIVGLVTFIVAVLSFYILSEYPHSSHFLKQEERDHVIARVHEERDDEEEDDHGIRKSLVEVIANWRIWAYVSMSIAVHIPIYCYAIYSAAIVARMKSNTLSVRMQLTVIIPPYIIAFCALLLAGYLSDKLRSRGKVVIAGSALAVFGHLFLILNQETAVNYWGMCVVCPALYIMLPIILVWGTENYRGHIQRTIACTLIISLGQIGGVVNKRIFKDSDKPDWIPGYAVSLGLCAFAGIAAAGMMYMNKLHNRRNGGAVFSI